MVRHRRGELVPFAGGTADAAVEFVVVLIHSLLVEVVQLFQRGDLLGIHEGEEAVSEGPMASLDLPLLMRFYA